jgi:uncharacterized protein YndB with AHSA1/START domain
MAGPLMHQVNIAAPADRIYEAITTSEGLSSFWVPGSRAEAVKGSVAQFDFGPGAHLEMRVDELETDRRVGWTCLGDFPGWAGTTIVWELSAADDGFTSVLFKHEGWAGEMTHEDLAPVNYTWGGVVGRLKAHAETGEVAPFLG